MKTAGTTFAAQLKAHFGPEAVFPCRDVDFADPTDVTVYQNVDRLVSTPPDRRTGVRVYTGHFPYMARDLLDPSLAALTILRDPVERTLSLLRQFQRSDPRFRNATLPQIYENEMVFRWFVHNHQTKVFALTPEDGARNVFFPLPIDDERFARACENLRKCSVVGLTEHYDAFLGRLNDHFCWWPAALPTETRNVDRLPRACEDGLRERIAEDNRYDLAFYDFARHLTGRAP